MKIPNDRAGCAEKFAHFEEYRLRLATNERIPSDDEMLHKMINHIWRYTRCSIKIVVFQGKSMDIKAMYNVLKLTLLPVTCDLCSREAIVYRMNVNSCIEHAPQEIDGFINPEFFDVSNVPGLSLEKTADYYKVDVPIKAHDASEDAKLTWHIAAARLQDSNNVVTSRRYANQRRPNHMVRRQVNEFSQTILTSVAAKYSEVCDLGCGNSVYKYNLPVNYKGIDKVVFIKQNRTTLFSGVTSPLSNFYPCAIRVADVTFASVEHAYQLSKVKMCCPHLLNEYIALASQPANVVKRWITANVLELTSDWQAVKIPLMQALLKLKYEACAAYRQSLHKAGAEIVENTPNKFWGGQAGGSNALGKLHMELRKEKQIVFDGNVEGMQYEQTCMMLNSHYDIDLSKCVFKNDVYIFGTVAQGSAAPICEIRGVTRSSPSYSLHYYDQPLKRVKDLEAILGPAEEIIPVILKGKCSLELSNVKLNAYLLEQPVCSQKLCQNHLEQYVSKLENYRNLQFMIGIKLLKFKPVPVLRQHKVATLATLMICSPPCQEFVVDYGERIRVSGGPAIKGLTISQIAQHSRQMADRRYLLIGAAGYKKSAPMAAVFRSLEKGCSVIGIDPRPVCDKELFDAFYQQKLEEVDLQCQKFDTFVCDTYVNGYQQQVDLMVALWKTLCMHGNVGSNLFIKVTVGFLAWETLEDLLKIFSSYRMYRMPVDHATTEIWIYATGLYQVTNQYAMWPEESSLKERFYGGLSAIVMEWEHPDQFRLTFFGAPEIVKSHIVASAAVIIKVKSKLDSFWLNGTQLHPGEFSSNPQRYTLSPGMFNLEFYRATQMKNSKAFMKQWPKYVTNTTLLSKIYSVRYTFEKLHVKYMQTLFDGHDWSKDDAFYYQSLGFFDFGILVPMGVDRKGRNMPEAIVKHVQAENHHQDYYVDMAVPKEQHRECLFDGYTRAAAISGFLEPKYCLTSGICADNLTVAAEVDSGFNECASGVSMENASWPFNQYILPSVESSNIWVTYNCDVHGKAVYECCKLAQQTVGKPTCRITISADSTYEQKDKF
jgi:predicted NAD-dependent protein-ADP-ribosyltransferase YbiA (DUF1768 family)